ncbi:MAG: DMT family transporter [Pseudomonadota bacterium]
MEFLARPKVALVFFVFAMAMIPLNDSLIKLMSDKFSIFQILGVRALFSLALVLLIPGTLSSVIKLKLRTWLKLMLRGLCLVGAMLFFFLPLSILPLADVTAIFFMSPLLITLLSVPFLGEKLGVFRLSAVVIGLIGVMIIVRPGGEGFQIAYLLPIISASSYAAFQIITRYIRNEAPVPAMVAVQNLIYMSVGFIGVAILAVIAPDTGGNQIMAFLLRGWETPDSWDLLLLGVCGLIVLNLAYASTNVYSNVEATYVAPFEYIALPMAVFWGFVIWIDIPDFHTWIGMTLIIGGGIFMIYRENKRSTEVASSVPMRASATNTTNVETEVYLGGETESL